MPFLGAEPQSEAMEAPPMPSAKNTWAMATGLSEGGKGVDVYHSALLNN